MLGAVGILMVALAIVLDAPGMLERQGNWWRVLITFAGHVLLLVAWWQLGPLWRRPRLTAAIWSAVMVAMPPLHSRDAYSYAAQGHLLREGLDPYLVPSGEAGYAGLLVGTHWFETTSVYPPLSLKIFEFVSWLFQGHLYWTPIGMRLPNLVALLVLAWALTRLARHVGVAEGVALWAGVLNPVVLIQWVGGIHNDAIMVAALSLAFLASFNTAWRGWAGMLAGGAGIGLAMSIKQSAAVAGVGMVALAWAASSPTLAEHRRTWGALITRAAGAGASAVAVFAATTLLTGLGLGWNNPTAGNPLMATSNAPISWVASFLRFHEIADPDLVVEVFTTFCSVLIVAAVVWLVVRYGPRPGRRGGHPWVVIVGSLGAFAVLGPALQPWYFTWLLPFIVLLHPSHRSGRLFVVLTVVTALLAPLQDALPPYVAMALLVLPARRLWRRLSALKVPVFSDQGLTR